MARKFQFVTNEIYHVFNRGAGKADIFLDRKDFLRWDSLLYHSLRYNYPYSLFLNRTRQTAQSGNDPSKVIDAVEALHSISPPPVVIVARVTLSSHYHLVLKQITENGISQFLHRVGTAYSNYFNVKNERSGTLWQGPFGAVRVETEKQFLHLVRYVHVNPLAAGLVTQEGLLDYPWSSLPGYLGLTKDRICGDKELLLSHFKNISSFQEFTLAPFSQEEINLFEGVTLDDDFEWFTEREAIKKEQRQKLIEEFRA